MKIKVTLKTDSEFSKKLIVLLVVYKIKNKYCRRTRASKSKQRKNTRPNKISTLTLYGGGGGIPKSSKKVIQGHSMCTRMKGAGEADTLAVVERPKKADLSNDLLNHKTSSSSDKANFILAGGQQKLWTWP